MWLQDHWKVLLARPDGGNCCSRGQGLAASMHPCLSPSMCISLSRLFPSCFPCPQAALASDSACRQPVLGGPELEAVSGHPCPEGAVAAAGALCSLPAAGTRRGRCPGTLGTVPAHNVPLFLVCTVMADTPSSAGPGRQLSLRQAASWMLLLHRCRAGGGRGRLCSSRSGPGAARPGGPTGVRGVRGLARQLW